MKRVFTQTISDRYKVGMIKDYPMTTWNGFADSLGVPLDEFSKPQPEQSFVGGVEGSSMVDNMIQKRGPGRPRKEEVLCQ